MNVRSTLGVGVLSLCAFHPSRVLSQDLARPNLEPFVPPPCVAGQEMFSDVPASNPFCPWIEQLARDHVTGGCAPQLFCPTAPLTRQQMSAFLELAMRGTDSWIVNADLLDGMDSADFVTGVSAGMGLSGGGAGGTLSIAVAPSFQLPQSCTGGQHPEWTGTGWTCGDPGTGTVTSVGTGAGLTGGPITTSGTIAVATDGITSAMIADGTVASADIADGAVTGADISDGSIAGADIAPGAVGSGHVNSTQIQLRVATPCSGGEFIRAVNADGTVVCAPDADSGGTVTSVATGAGLTGGPITGSGTIGVATGGITSAMIADGSVASADIADGTIGAADVNSSQVQRRVSQACTTSQFMRAVNADGTVTCDAEGSHTHFGQSWGGSIAGYGLVVSNSLGPGIRSSSTSTSGEALLAVAEATSGTVIGVHAIARSTSAMGVRGLADAPTGNTFGVGGYAISTSGTGVVGSASATTGTTRGVSGSANSSDGTGVEGRVYSSSGQTTGVYGKSESVSGTGVRGEATFLQGGTDPSYGVVGLNHRDLGAGVRGEGPSEGVQGIATGSSTTAIGVHGTSSSTAGNGVLGEATATTGQAAGVRGTTTSTTGRGIQGEATATTGQNYGVHGFSASTSGRGVIGVTTALSGPSYGVQGINNSTSGTGVAGFAAATSGSTIGVYGRTESPSGYGGYFSGRVLVTSNANAPGDMTVVGNLSVLGTKNFKIDHPLDPANRYLVHAAVESSEVLNLYSGTVVLDANGAATVALPDWFEALNRDFRYQLTCVGGYAPVYIAAKIRDGRFGIAGGMPGLEVSWQVTAVRSDAHMRAHPMAVEQDKPEEERGTYLDPEAHGQPAEAGRDYKITGAAPKE